GMPREQVVSRVCDDGFDLRLPLEAMIQRLEERREVEDGLREIDRFDRSQGRMNRERANRGACSDAGDERRLRLRMQQRGQMAERRHITASWWSVVGIAPAVHQQLLITAGALALIAHHNEGRVTSFSK